MKFTAAAALAFAAGAMAGSNVTVVTEVVESYVTYCPEPTEITHGTLTYTVTEPTTLTITDCPCTITHPVTTATSYVCTTSTGFVNSTIPGVPPPTGGVPPPSTTAPPPSVPTAAAGKIALSGAAGVLGLAAFFL